MTISKTKKKEGGVKQVCPSWVLYSSCSFLLCTVATGAPLACADVRRPLLTVWGCWDLHGSRSLLCTLSRLPGGVLLKAQYQHHRERGRCASTCFIFSSAAGYDGTLRGSWGDLFASRHHAARTHRQRRLWCALSAWVTVFKAGANNVTSEIALPGSGTVRRFFLFCM